MMNVNDTTMMSAYYEVAEAGFEPALGFMFARYLQQNEKNR